VPLHQVAGAVHAELVAARLDLYGGDSKLYDEDVWRLSPLRETENETK
jgi:hypothetical protein